MNEESDKTQGIKKRNGELLVFEIYKKKHMNKIVTLTKYNL
jgi:hypothetical protein